MDAVIASVIADLRVVSALRRFIGVAEYHVVVANIRRVLILVDYPLREQIRNRSRTRESRYQKAHVSLFGLLVQTAIRKIVVEPLVHDLVCRTGEAGMLRIPIKGAVFVLATQSDIARPFAIVALTTNVNHDQRDAAIVAILVLELFAAD